MEDVFEILPDKLYYLPVKHGDNPVMQFSRYECFCVDEELVYWNFFLDFGPLNLGQLYRFCLLVNRKIGTKLMPRPVNRPLLLYAGPSRQKQTNAVYLLLSYLLLYHDKSVQELCFEHKSLSALCESCLRFHDASQGICTYNLTVVDCLRGLKRARELRFFDFDRFDVLEYEHFESVENGDLNWIVYPNLCGDDSRYRSMHKPMLAFAGPHYCHSVSPEGYVTLTPDSYIDYFKKKDVGLVVRLNKKMYDETEFTRNDIRHIEHSYQDGSIPPLPLLMTIIDKMESSNGGIAVHCKAGLGRTGTIIGAYLMKHFDMTHSEVIGWMRICRPGMVIGPQQHFLKDIENIMRYEGSVFRNRVDRGVSTSDEKNKAMNKNMNKNMKNLTIHDRTTMEENERIENLPDSQADRLLMARNLQAREVLR